MTLQSHLSRHVLKPATSKAQLDAMAARAWLDYGIMLIRPEDLPNPLDRRAALNIVEKKYGKRRDCERQAATKGESQCRK